MKFANRIAGRFLYPLLFLALSLMSCEEQNIPRRRAYLRIDLPEHAYRSFDTTYPYRFEYPVYASILPQVSGMGEPYWITVDYPAYRGKIYISYKKVNGNLTRLMEDSRELLMKHIPKADAITNRIINDPQKRTFGVIYDIEGVQSASACQFVVTDSTDHFLRGSLYFEAVPNNDSLAPVIKFIKKDIDHLIKTLQWK